MNMPQYFLRKHVFVCPTTWYWVVLDRSNDKYLCIDRASFDALGPWLCGHAAALTNPQLCSNEMPPEVNQLAMDLISKGILNEGVGDTKELRPVDAEHPAYCISTDSAHLSLGSKILHLPSFLFACWKADRMLKGKSFERTVRYVEQRKQHRPARLSSIDPQLTAKLVSIFRELRPVYPRNYLCMFDSLAILNFLALHSAFPTWVFGVTADPFEAHCWVQEGAMLLTDSLPLVSKFTPIMSI